MADYLRRSSGIVNSGFSYPANCRCHLRGGHVFEAEELAVEVGQVREAAAEGDFRDGVIGFCEEEAGAADTELLEAGGGFAGARFEEPDEGSLDHISAESPAKTDPVKL